MAASILLRSVAAAVAALALLGALGSSALAAPAQCKAEPGEHDIEQARKHMSAGVAFMQDPDGARYEEAYTEFRKAYELSCSLNALQNLAICAQKLELDGEAIGYYQRYLKEKGNTIAPDTKRQVTKDLAALQAAVAWVTLSCDRPGATVTDVRTPRRGQPVTNIYECSITPKKLGIHPGNHELTAERKGDEDRAWQQSFENGGRYQHTFYFHSEGAVTAEGFTDEDLKGPDHQLGPDELADEDGERPVPVYVWVTGGITLALAVPMTIFMVQASSAKSDYDEARGVAPMEEQESLKEDVETNNLLADVFLGATAAGAVTTLILFLTRPTVYDDEVDQPAQSERGETRIGFDWTLAPSLDPRGGGGAVFSARF